MPRRWRDDTSSFVGREIELAQVRALLSESRLVTVTGIGGVGKTRLALRAAGLDAARFRHGAVVVELSTVRDPALLYHGLVSALGLAAGDGVPGLEMLTESLRERSLLLVLDACEHLAGECARFAEAVLREAPDVSVLATSRQPLAVDGEDVYRLAPMSVPDSPATGAACEAAELFAQRAASVVPGFRVTADNWASILSVCRQLDGIPLAIELAAVRLRALSLDVLARRLDRRLTLLAGGRRGGDVRHHTLRAAIGWSYDLCTSAEQVLWARLSVFAGEFGLEAAEDVCADGELPRTTIARAIAGLADQSVLVRAGGRECRFRMLDTIREYGAERLAALPSGAEVRTRHIRRYLRMAEELDADPVTVQPAAYLALRAEHDDIRAAIRAAFAAPGQERTAARLVTGLYWYWMMSGLIQESRHWLALALKRLAGPSVERARALMLHGAAVAVLGDPAAGVADCEAGLALAGELGDQKACARGHLYYCQALFAVGRFDASAAAARTAASLLAEFGDCPATRLLSVYRGLRALLAGDPHACAAACGRELRRVRPGTGQQPDARELWISGLLEGLSGLALFLMGETDHGSGLVREVLADRDQLKDLLGMAYGLGMLAFMAATQRRYRRAAWLAGAAIPLWERIGAEFPGVPGLAELSARAAADARKALGADTYARLHHAGGRFSLRTVITLATGDADDLPVIPEQPPSPEPAVVPRRDSGVIALSDREREVAVGVSSGLTNREIAGKLGLSPRTVDAHVMRIFEKLGVSSRAEFLVRS